MQDFIHPLSASPTPIKLRAELTIQCENGQPNNASTQLLTFVLSRSTMLVGKFFTALLLQFLVNQALCWRPTRRGRGQVKGHPGQASGRRSGRTTYNPFWLQTASVTLWTNLHSYSSTLHTSRWQHTPYLDIYIYYVRAAFGMPSSGFGTLMLTGGALMFFDFFVRANFQLPKMLA